MKVSWDDDILNIWKNESHVPNHQPSRQSSIGWLQFQSMPQKAADETTDAAMAAPR
jgi:hypothetical protein